MTIVLCMTAIVGIASVLRGYQADSQKRPFYAAAAYSSIINELNILSVNRQSGWTHRGLDLVAKASSIDTPLRDARQLRDWTVSMLTIPDFDMTIHKRFTGSLSPTDIAYSPSGRFLAVGLATTDASPWTTIVLVDLDTDASNG